MSSPTIATRLARLHASNVAAATIHIGLLLQVARPQSFSTLIFTFIVIAPPALISVAAALMNNRGIPRAYAQTLSIIYMLFGLWAYYDAIYIHPDPQNGLIFIVVPILGIIATTIGSILMLLVFNRVKPKAPKND